MSSLEFDSHEKAPVFVKITTRQAKIHKKGLIFFIMSKY